MSEATVNINEDNFLSINRDQTIIFLGGNRYDKEVYENTTGGEKVLPAGTIMGRIAATGKLLPLASAAVDGSQFPVGVLAEGKTVADTVEVNVSICVEGDVAQEKLVFDGADDLSTVIDGRQLRDRIAGDNVGINLVSSVSNQEFDN